MEDDRLDHLQSVDGARRLLAASAPAADEFDKLLNDGDAVQEHEQEGDALR